VNNPIIKKFNAKFHKTKYATDVLAFNLSTDKKVILADIVVSVDMAKKQAVIFKTTPNYELFIYLAHGVLHLLGYNDNNKRQAAIMRKKESKYVH
jgi:probable rRNA maturation factor